MVFQEQAPQEPVSTTKVNSAAASLALGHRLVHAVENGEATDFSDLARRLNVSQARVSMLVALTFLAPNIQEQIMANGAETAHLNIHHLLLVARLRTWTEQRAFWKELLKNV
jgi:hypothetical protein